MVYYNVSGCLIARLCKCDFEIINFDMT